MKSFFITIILVVLICSCNTVEKDKEVIPVKTEESDKIGKVNFFMETSGSMTGYLKGATAFRDKLPNLLVSIERKIDSGNVPLRKFYISDSVTLFRGTTQEFIDTLALNKHAKGRSSQMDRIFQMVADRTDSNDISILVSDCILSYPVSVIKKEGKEINRLNAAGKLKSDIQNTFEKLKRNNICASLFSFESYFNGTYWDYSNNTITLESDVIRPYYIWILGRKSLLTHFTDQLKSLAAFSGTGFSIEFGVFMQPIDSFTVLFKFGKKGDWSTDYTALNGIDATDKNPAQFAIALDLSSLPGYARDTTYLKNNLKRVSAGVEFDIARIILSSTIDRSKLKQKEQTILNSSTHVLLIEVSNVYQDGKIELQLPLRYDTTYKAYSTMDDRDKKTLGGKTFALEHLVDGVKEAYENSTQYFIQISIPVKQ